MKRFLSRSNLKRAGWTSSHASTAASALRLVGAAIMIGLVPGSAPNPNATFATGTTVLPSAWIGSPNTDFTVAVDPSDSPILSSISVAFTGTPDSLGNFVTALIGWSGLPRDIESGTQERGQSLRFFSRG